MTHPQNLHALAALWDLRQAWEAATRTAEAALTAALDNDRGILQAWRPAPPGRSIGRHADPVGGGIGGNSSASIAYDRCRRLAGNAEQAAIQVGYLIASDTGLSRATYRTMAAITVGIRTVRPETAREITYWLTDADRHLRRSLALEPALEPLNGNPECPSCTVRLLRLRTAAPVRADRTIICDAGCRCVGDNCPCGMPVRAKGVLHIWQCGTALPKPLPAGPRRVRSKVHA